MFFNSLEFFVFLTAVCALYAALAHRGQNWMLLAASYFFYGWWDVRFLFLIAVSTAVDYNAGLLIQEGRLRRRELLTSSLWVIGAALLFMLPPWRAWDGLPGSADVAVSGIARNALGWWVLGGTLVTVGLTTRFHTGLARLSEDKRRRICVLTSVITNLGILGFFKYFNFFAESAVIALQSIGFEAHRATLAIVLPVGISFYTFQTMGYTIDIYRGTQRACRRFGDFALYVSYFPQLVAGPIERATHLLPLIERPRRPTLAMARSGGLLILRGMFKKVAIADGVARTVDQIYATPGVLSGGEVLLGTALFAIQIYCDFSGYTDIARGVSRLLGIELMRNFNLPYFARSAQEFWRRWHISLSTWLRDYLYIPLGGSRGGKLGTYRNLVLTMMLGGLWHGAAWNFVLWGLYHGVVLVLGRIKNDWLGDAAWRRNALVQVGALGVSLVITLYGWLLFRADSFESIVRLTAALVTGLDDWTIRARLPTFAAVVGIPLLFLMEGLEYLHGGGTLTERLLAWGRHPLARGAAYAWMVFALILGLNNAHAQFIYFQF